MKKSVFTIVFIAISFFAKAQDSTIALSAFEKLATSVNSYFRFEEKPIGVVRGESVTVVKIKKF